MAGEKAPFAKSSDYGKNDKSSMNAGGSWSKKSRQKPFKGARVANETGTGPFSSSKKGY